uniref:EF-hand domain-containing protein n=1 Tax=Eutreptiella gymnastica TaxID=73025 RepID=A0A7S1HXC9_9EUGL|mmetsp:Transcript_111783/g.194001  ORF Transcript_111783/g.194001 Transcript_111783/m.194001 type:complete len:647 (+) Transcript_111783:87-2027(+)
MPHCIECGARNVDHARFCIECGTPTQGHALPPKPVAPQGPGAPPLLASALQFVRERLFTAHLGLEDAYRHACRGMARMGPVELKHLLEEHLGPDCLTADDFLRVMLLLDRNRDGWLDYDEFRVFMEQGAAGFEAKLHSKPPLQTPSSQGHPAGNGGLPSVPGIPSFVHSEVPPPAAQDRPSPERQGRPFSNSAKFSRSPITPRMGTPTEPKDVYKTTNSEYGSESSTTATPSTARPARLPSVSTLTSTPPGLGPSLRGSLTGDSLRRLAGPTDYYSVGQEVEVLRSDGCWNPATVAVATAEGGYTVRFRDGKNSAEKEKRLDAAQARHKLRLPAGQAINSPTPDLTLNPDLRPNPHAHLFGQPTPSDLSMTYSRDRDPPPNPDLNGLTDPLGPRGLASGSPLVTTTPLGYPLPGYASTGSVNTPLHPTSYPQTSGQGPPLQSSCLAGGPEPFSGAGHTFHGPSQTLPFVGAGSGMATPMSVSSASSGPKSVRFDQMPRSSGPVDMHSSMPSGRSSQSTTSVRSLQSMRSMRSGDWALGDEHGTPMSASHSVASLGTGRFKAGDDYMKGLMREFKSKLEQRYDCMRDAFLQMDEDRDGFIGNEEFRKLLLKWGIHAGELELNSITDSFDIDGDGQVSAAEFLKTMAF